MPPEPLFGRAAESAALTRALAAPSGVVAVVGEAGIGKSALVSAALVPATLTSAARTSAALSPGSPGAGPRRALPSAVGRAVPSPSAPLRPLVEVALGAMRHGADPAAERLRLHRRALAALLPGIEPAGPGTEPVGLPAVVLADALLQLVDTASQRCVVVVEDLHWADEETLATVEALADRCAAGAGLLVLTSRPEGAAWELLRRLAQRRVLTLVELGPLDPDDVDRVVAHRLGVEPSAVPAGLRDLAARAGGRPLWVEEIVSAAVGTGALRRTGGSWELAAAPGPVVPATLGAGVRARLATLDPDVRTVVELAAVAGPEPDAALLAAALDWSPRRVGDAARAGVAEALLVLGARGEVGFRHELLRDAVLSGLVDAERRDHARTLLAAVVGPGAAPERTAAIALTAGEPARAAELLAEAARRDLARGLPAAAARHLDAALDLPPGPAGIVGLRALRVEALALAGDVERALADAPAVDAALAAEPDADPRRRALGEAVVRATLGSGRIGRARGLADALRARFPRAAPTAALVALVAMEQGDPAAAAEAAGAALAAPDADAATRCQAMEVLGRLARRRDLDEAQRWFHGAVAEAERAGLALWRARALHELATVAQVRAFDLDPMARARRAAVDAAAPGLLAAVDFQLAAVRGVRFEPDLALPAARSLLDTARRTGAHRQEAFAWVLVGQAHATAGRAREAALAHDEARRLAPADAEIEGLGGIICRGLPALLADDVATGAAHWVAGIEALRRTGTVQPFPPWFLWPVLATVLDPEGDGGAAARAETGGPELRLATGADALWHLADAVARGRAGDRAGAATALARADDRFAAVPAFAGYEHLGRRLAAVAALDDGWGDPAAWLVRGERWARDRGHPGLARACRSLGGRAGVRRTRAGRGDATVPPHLVALGVTSREMDVLLLIAEGLPNRAIAERLYLAPRTVKGHVELLLAKTGAANRTQLARHLAP